MTAEETIAQAEQVAADLAIQAAPEELLAAAADHECGPGVLAVLLAHELAASHRLMQRIAAVSDGMLDWSQKVNGADEAGGLPAGDGSSAELHAARLAGVAGRLMEQVRPGLVVLRRLRPGLPEDDEGIWLALRWTEDRCPPEELERRLAAAKAARAQHDDLPAPATAPLSERAQALRAMALEAAAGLAKEAGVADLATATAAERGGTDFVARLLAYELGAMHELTMRLAGCADRAFDRAVDAEEEPAVALQLSTAAARLGDRFRRGLLALQPRTGGPDKPRKIAGTIWGGSEPSLDTGRAADNDAPDAPAAAPAATIPAGHGVHRSDSADAGRPIGIPRRPAA